jgi:single-stranded DNA-binding protein
MSVFVLVSGALFRGVGQRTAKSGRTFVTGTIRVKDGDTSQFWRVLAFGNTAQNEIMRLADGDAVSIQGELKTEIYQPENGEPRLNLTVVANVVSPLRRPAKARAKSADASNPDPRIRRERCAGAWSPDQGLDDAIPF